MARRSQPAEGIIPKRLTASAIRQTRPIPDGVIGVGGLIDLGTGGRELVQDLVTWLAGS
jgi:hypothetical protein